MTQITVDPRIHVRYQGNTYDYLVNDLDISSTPSDSEIISEIERQLTTRLGSNVSLSGYEVTRYESNGLYDLHPQAKFGK